jgi:HEAT repeat protein
MDLSMRNRLVLAIAGGALLVLIVLLVWGIRWADGRGPKSFPIPPELRQASERSRAIASKEDDPGALTAQDWADTQSMIADPDWRIRARGLTVLPLFKRTIYADQAWQLALAHLAHAEPISRTFATHAAAALRPDEAARYIAPLLEDPDKDVRDAAKHNLIRLGYSTIRRPGS